MTLSEHFIQAFSVKHVRERLEIFSHFQTYWGAKRHIQAYSGIIEGYGAIVTHIRNTAYPLRYNASLYNWAIFKTLIYLEPEASSKICRTCKMTMDIQNPGIFEQVIREFSYIFRGIQWYWCIFGHTNKWNTMEKEEDSSVLFENQINITKTRYLFRTLSEI